MFVSPPAGISDHDGRHRFAAVQAAGVALSAGNHVVVAGTDSTRLHGGQVGAGVRLAEELPGAPFSPENGGQEVLLLLLRAPDEDAGTPQASTGIIVGGQMQAVAVQLLLEDDDEIDTQFTAAVLFR